LSDLTLQHARIEWRGKSESYCFENNCENANTYPHGGVGTFAKEKKLELKRRLK
jgi:hypothetical protein